MTIEVKTWEAPVITLDATYLTNSNIEEVGRWMGADFIQVTTDLRTIARTVTFQLVMDDRPGIPGRTIARAKVGEYVVRKNAHINEYGETVPDQYYALSEGEIRPFHEKTKE